MLTSHFLMNLENLFLTQNQFTKQTTEIVNDASIVSIILTSLIVFSLILTFAVNSTTVHKVLGLLLVSIFVVLLWTLQTQFLFIYIVYIMAFISAVLMLFLSVVLMLPISTLTSKNYATDSKHNHYSVFPILIVYHEVQPYDMSFISNSLLCALLIIAFGIAMRVSGNGCILDRIKHLIGDNMGIKELMIDMTDIELMQKFLSYAQIANWGFILPSYLQSILNYAALLTYFLMSLCKFLVSTITALFEYGLVKTHIISLLVHKHIKNLFETAIQTYLYLGLIVPVLALLTVKQAWFNAGVNSLSFENSLGLSQIKELLYGDFSYFLLFSTVVLLVALLGAAVMTRNKR